MTWLARRDAGGDLENAKVLSRSDENGRDVGLEVEFVLVWLSEKIYFYVPFS